MPPSCRAGAAALGERPTSRPSAEPQRALWSCQARGIARVEGGGRIPQVGEGRLLHHRAAARRGLRHEIGTRRRPPPRRGAPTTSETWTGPRLTRCLTDIGRATADLAPQGGLCEGNAAGWCARRFWWRLGEGGGKAGPLRGGTRLARCATRATALHNPASPVLPLHHPSPPTASTFHTSAASRSGAAP